MLIHLSRLYYPQYNDSSNLELYLSSLLASYIEIKRERVCNVASLLASYIAPLQCQVSKTGFAF